MNFEGVVLSKIVIKGQIPWDSIYMRFLEKSDSRRQKAEGWVLGAGGKGGVECSKGAEPGVWEDEKVLTDRWW